MAGMRARVVSPDAAKLTRQMNAIGKASRPIFREAGDQISQLAARDLKAAAHGFSGQSRSLASAVSAKRDRVPYVSVKPQGIYRLRGSRKRDAVRAGDVALGSEYGSRRRNVFTTHHGAQPQAWKPGGYWWNPTIDANRERWERLWLKALDEVLRRAGG